MGFVGCCVGEMNVVYCCCCCFEMLFRFLRSSLLEGYLHLYFGFIHSTAPVSYLGITTSSAKKLPRVHRVVHLNKGEEEMVF